MRSAFIFLILIGIGCAVGSNLPQSIRKNSKGEIVFNFRNDREPVTLSPTKVDDTTIELNNDEEIQIKDSGVTETKIAPDAVTTGKVADDSLVFADTKLRTQENHPSVDAGRVGIGTYSNSFQVQSPNTTVTVSSLNMTFRGGPTWFYVSAPADSSSSMEGICQIPANNFVRYTLDRGAGAFKQWTISTFVSGSTPPAPGTQYFFIQPFGFIYDMPAGTYTVQLKSQTWVSTGCTWRRLALHAYELTQ